MYQSLESMLSAILIHRQYNPKSRRISDHITSFRRGAIGSAKTASPMNRFPSRTQLMRLDTFRSKTVVEAIIQLMFIDVVSIPMRVAVRTSLQTAHEEYLVSGVSSELFPPTAVE